MEFGDTKLEDAQGAILAHSLKLGSKRLKKGMRLSATDIQMLREHGFDHVVTTRPSADDMDEDIAASAVAEAIIPDPNAAFMELAAAFTGRANIFARESGVLRVNHELVAKLNNIDEAITFASLPDYARVKPRQMLGTVKIIPYAVPQEAVEAARNLLANADSALTLHPQEINKAAILLTQTEGMPEKLLTKGALALRARLDALDVATCSEDRLAHETGALAHMLRQRAKECRLVLVLTGSANSDRRDVGPAAIEAAGGKIIRFGMPVDPGNLLALGRIGETMVLIMPGCVRSPALNGADWVLERLVCGLEVTDADIAAMGVGGLLKEIPSRPQPRRGDEGTPLQPRISGILLAAGAARRMEGADKMLQDAHGVPVLRHVACAMLDAGLEELIVVTRPQDHARREALSGLSIKHIENPHAAEGMASSMRAGLAAISEDADAVVFALGDMPELAPIHFRKIMAAFSPADGRVICRAVDETGKPGHPVLFGQRFFENMMLLEGDQGAREILRAHAEFMVDVPTNGRGATLDLDTPKAWKEWQDTRAVR